MMNRLLVLLFLCAVASAQEKSQNLHDFGLWGVYMKDASLGVALKATFIAGFTNGLFAGGSVIGGSAAPENKFLACVRTMSQEQIIALVDKYYINNPEDWHHSISWGIVSALTVKGSPCGEVVESKKDH